MSNSSAFTRRRMLASTGLSLVGGAMTGGLPGLSNASLEAAEWQPLNRYPRMVHEYLLEKVRAAERAKLQKLEALNSKEDAEAYVESVQRRIRECFGPEPERTELNARITGELKRAEYSIEKLIFESRPGFFVTANLYLPRGNRAPAPGVIGTCGHSTNGKAAEAYQAFAQGLARQGYVCLLYDPIGQGERLQYPNPDAGPKIAPGVQEHLQAGNQQFLVGEFFGSWRAWDGIRALDYLLTRPEVDPKHIGVTGNSGGGTMTTWLCGLERRFTMAAPSCFVTTFRRNFENELPADTEQCPPQVLRHHLDHDDFLAAMAPKPVIILAKERDYFDVRGSQEAYQRLRKLYGLLGAEDNIGLFIGPTYHGYSQENREAMYRWFHRATGVSEAKQEPPITIEPDESLWCAPDGQVDSLAGNRTVFDFTRDQSQALAKRRVEAGSQRELAARLRRVLKLPAAPDSAPDYRIYRYLGSRDYPSSHAIAYSVQTEPEVHAVVYRLTDERWYSRPPKAAGPAILYVAHLSSDEELRTEPLVKQLREQSPKSAFYSCDVRGIGESLPNAGAPDSFHSKYGSDYFFAIHSIMLDRPYLGQKTWDVLRVVDWLRTLGHDQVHLVGNGWGSLPATFAAVLSPSVTQVTLQDAFESYQAIAESEYYDLPLSTLLPGVLHEFDLPDCYAALKSKQLRR